MKRISAVIDMSEIKEKEALLKEQKDVALYAEEKAQEANKAKSYFIGSSGLNFLMILFDRHMLTMSL